MVKVPSKDPPVYWVDHPLTEAEKRWRESGYKDDLAPPGYDPDERIMSPGEEALYWAERAKTPETHITFYGSAPHRPTPAPAADLVDKE